MITRPKVLRFGIQSLDKLIGRIDEDQEIYGIDLSKPEDNDRSDSDDEMITSSICLIGPDGTGKSVFSLHIASQYLVDCINEKATPDNAAIPDLDQIKRLAPRLRL